MCSMKNMKIYPKNDQDLNIFWLNNYNIVLFEFFFSENTD